VSDLAHRIEPASSARAKCRGCGERIAGGELRFGESLPNPFADGEMTLWFHLDCAAFKRPEPFLQTLEGRSEPLEGQERLVAEARLGLAHRRLPLRAARLRSRGVVRRFSPGLREEELAELQADLTRPAP
jgi:hypothetical protein